jgi:hypothetical protein
MINASFIPASLPKKVRLQSGAIKQRSPAGARWAGRRIHQIEKFHHGECSILEVAPFAVKLSSQLFGILDSAIF